jgi:excisionase family DNA binding protein
MKARRYAAPRTSLLTIRDVALELSVSVRTAYRLVERGVLVPVRIGRLARYHPDDVEQLKREGVR